MIATRVRKPSIVLTSIGIWVLGAIPTTVLVHADSARPHGEVRPAIQSAVGTQTVGGLNLAKVREKLTSDKASEKLRVVRAAERQLRMLDIVEAKTLDERHDLVRALPVSIVTTQASDGRSGTMKRFVIEGKTKFQVFMPSSTSLNRSRPEVMHSSGPSADPAPVDCYDGPEPCITWTEMDDLGIIIAQAEADTAAAQADYDSGCSVYPEDCTSPEVPSGPSDSGPCSAHAAEATIAIVVSSATMGAAALEVAGGYAAGLTLTTGGALVLGTAVAGAGLAAGYYGWKWVRCAWQFTPVAITAGSVALWYEKTYR